MKKTPRDFLINVDTGVAEPATTKPEGSDEFFYLDKTGKKQDVRLHNPILEEGDHEAALEVSRAVGERRRATKAKAGEKEKP